MFVFACAALTAIFIRNQTAVKYIHYLCAFSYIVYIYLVFEESISKKTVRHVQRLDVFHDRPSYGVSPCRALLLHVGAEGTRYLASLIRAVIQAVLLALFLRMGRPYRRVLEVVSDRIVGLMSLYPVIGFLLLVNNYTLSFARVREVGSVYELLFFLAFIVLGYVLVFAGILSASKIMSLQYDVQIQERDISERKRVAMEQEHNIAELQEAISQVKQLSGLLPICASCKKIRNDAGGWEHWNRTSDSTRKQTSATPSARNARASFILNTADKNRKEYPSFSLQPSVSDPSRKAIPSVLL